MPHESSDKHHRLKKRPSSKKRSRPKIEPETSDELAIDSNWQLPDSLLPCPTTPDELHAWIKRATGITIARQPLIAGNAAPFDYLIHTFFEGKAPSLREGVGGRVGAHEPLAVTEPHPTNLVPTSETPPPTSSPDCIVWANRGGGKTFLGAIATMLDLLFKPGIEVRILAGSLEQARRMHTHLRNLFDPADRPDLAAAIRGRITERRLALRNGSFVELLAQSQTSVRGTRVQKLRCDEVDLFAPDVWDAAQLTTRSKRCGNFDVRGSVECLSTMHIPHGVMHRLVDEARGGRRRLFRWGVADVLESCPPERACGMQNGHSADGQLGQSESCGASTPFRPFANFPFGALPPTPAPCPLLNECGGRAKKRTPETAGHISIDDAITMKRRVPLTVWNTEMLCLGAKRTDAVLPEFDPKIHVVNQLPWDPISPSLREGAGGRVDSRPDSSTHRKAPTSDIPHPTSLSPHHDSATRIPPTHSLLAGMDFGIRSPTVVLFAVHDDRDILWIVDERIETGIVVADHALAIAQGLPRTDFAGWPKPQWIGVDPSGFAKNDQTAISAIDVLHKTGLAIRRRTMHIHEGLVLVRARLAPASADPPRLFIHARCQRLIESLERYHYPPNNPATTEPIKDGNDHAVDALRYLITNLDARFKNSNNNYIYRRIR